MAAAPETEADSKSDAKPETKPESKANTQATAKPESKERSRLEELFIWKTSEELKLVPAEEMKYTEIIRTLNVEKKRSAEAMDEAIRGLGQVKTKAEAEKALARHREALRKYQAVQLAELDRLRPLLGTERLARYLLVKNEITEKLKAVLTSGPTPAPVEAKTKNP